MKKSLVASLVILSSIALSGCATIINGTNQKIDFQSEPTGAIVELADGTTCETPCDFQLKRKNEAFVTITKEGFQTVIIHLRSSMGSTVAANVIAGGLIGVAIDSGNGSARHLTPNKVYVSMVPEGEEGEAMLLDEEGEVISTVAENNAGNPMY